MYSSSIFSEKRLELLIAHIHHNPLGLMIMQEVRGIEAHPLPFIITKNQEDQIILSAHISKQNSYLGALRARAKVLVHFQGPHGYISPSWYISKSLHHKVVPTWNYCCVQVKGDVSLIEDSVWLRQNLSDFTHQEEQRRGLNWGLDDAPHDYIDTMTKAIIGIEIKVSHIDGVYKLSQNKSPEDYQGVIDGLKACENDLGLVDMMQTYRPALKASAIET